MRSSMTASDDNAKDDIICRTQEVWQPRLGRELSREEATQISANLTGFFTLLAEWSRASLPEPANENGEPNTDIHDKVRHDR